MAGGITYGSMKTLLAEAAGNGVDPSSAFVLKATNSAIEELLHQEVIPVNAMATYDVLASGTTLLLPKELENAIEVEVQGAAEVNSQTDVTQGFYTLVNNFTYVDPSMQHDNPLVDQFLQPDPNDATILRRQYDYPGLTSNATVRITGKKRYIPITVDGDYPIIQNVAALKSMMISQERRYRCNDPDGAQKYKQDAIQILQAEVKQHLLDPNNSMKRKAAYDYDLANLARDTFGWMRARLALSLPSLQTQGKSEITRVMGDAEMRLMESGMWKGMLKEYRATVTAGYIYFPAEVQTVLAADICGNPIDIRSVFYEYAKNGPGLSWCNCSNILIEQGEDRFANNELRRLYKLTGSATSSTVINVVASLRWVAKAPTDFLVIKNFEAMRLMVMAIMDERAERWNEAIANQQSAVKVLKDELNHYLGGIKHALVIDDQGFGMNSMGDML